VSFWAGVPKPGVRPARPALGRRRRPALVDSTAGRSPCRRAEPGMLVEDCDAGPGGRRRRIAWRSTPGTASCRRGVRAAEAVARSRPTSATVARGDAPRVHEHLRRQGTSTCPACWRSRGRRYDVSSRSSLSRTATGPRDGACARSPRCARPRRRREGLLRLAPLLARRWSA
jgi:hypothetical protein